jgi:hypothetical protein
MHDFFKFSLPKSEKSLSHIKFIDADPADAATYFEKKLTRDKAAQMEYRNRKKSQDSINELFMLDIMREGIENGDPRLQ